MQTGKLSKILNNPKNVPRETPRKYIGASLIGSDCLRQIWYELQGADSELPEPRVKRIFEVGHRLEAMLIDLLRANGVDVSTMSETFEAKDVPYFKGHVDAYLPRYKAILEIKTAKASSFKVLVKKGVRGWYPDYYAQIQSYMGMAGIELTCLLAINKDDCDVYDEWVKFDVEYYNELVAKAKMIGEANIPPPRISGNPGWYFCKLCKYNGVCHDK